MQADIIEMFFCHITRSCPEPRGPIVLTAF